MKRGCVKRGNKNQKPKQLDSNKHAYNEDINHGLHCAFCIVNHCSPQVAVFLHEAAALGRQCTAFSQLIDAFSASPESFFKPAPPGSPNVRRRWSLKGA
jgi:hypothetical protein